MAGYRAEDDYDYLFKVVLIGDSGVGKSNKAEDDYDYLFDIACWNVLECSNIIVLTDQEMGFEFFFAKHTLFTHLSLSLIHIKVSSRL